MQCVRSDTRKLIAPFILFQFLTSPCHRSSLHLSHGLGSATDIFHPHAFLRQYYRSSTSLLWARSSFSISITSSNTCQPLSYPVQVLANCFDRHRSILSPTVSRFSHLGSPGISFTPFHVFRTIILAAASHTVFHRARNSERSDNTASVWLPIPDPVRVPHRSFANLTLFTSNRNHV